MSESGGMKDVVLNLFGFLRDKQVDSELKGLTSEQLAARAHEAERRVKITEGLRGAEGMTRKEKIIAQTVREKLGLHRVE